MISITKLVKNKPSFSDKLRYSEPGKGHKFEENGVFRPVVVFSITSQCNLFCKHCYYSARTSPEPDELSPEEIFRLSDDLGELGVPVVLLSGGEPMMKKGIFEIVRYMKEKGISVGISTNGTLLKPHVVEKLKESGADYVGISIDGFEKIHDEFRGKKGAFKLSVEGIENSISAGMRVSVRLTLSKFNSEQLSDILDWAEEKGVHRFCIYHLVGTGRGKNIKDSALSPEETRRIIEMVYEKSKILNMEILTVDAPFDGFFIALKRIEEGKEDEAKKIISMLARQGGDGTGKKIAVISHRGDVHLSQFWLNHSLGNIRERKFSEIWNDRNNDILLYLRTRVRHELEGRCGNCPIKLWCGGFRPRALSYTGKIQGYDPLCYLKDEEKKIIYEYLNQSN